MEVSIPNETEGRDYVEVDSATTPGLTYRVYPEHQYCNCPARGRCWHLSAVGMGEMTGSYCSSCSGDGVFISYPKLCLCERCGGTGIIGRAS